MLGPRGLTDSAYAGSSPAWRTHEPAETAAIGLIDHPLVLPVVAPPQEPETPVIDYFAAEAPAGPEPPAAAPAPVEDPAPTIELNTIPLAPPTPAPAESRSRSACRRWRRPRPSPCRRPRPPRP